MLNLTNKTAKEKAQLKSMELAKVKLSKFKKGDFDIEIIGDIKEIEVNGSNGIELFATAKKNGKQCGFGKDGTVEIERFRFFNPPVLVDDENGDIIREWTDEITKEVKQRKLKYDPTEVIRQSLAHTISLVGKSGENIIKGKVGNTTSTFYTSERAQLSKAGTGNWNLAHDSTSASSITRNSNTYAYTSSDYEIARVLVVYNTSALGDTDIIDSAVISSYANVITDTDNDGLDYISVVGSYPASNTEIVAGDYDQVGDAIDNPTKVSDDDKDLTSIGTGWKNWTLNASGLALISKTGYSRFGFREGHDIEDSPVSGFNSFQNYSTNPKLVVVHSASSSIKSINGLAKASIKSRNGLAIGSIKSINGLE